MAEISPLRRHMIEDMTVRNLAALAEPEAFATRLEQLQRVGWVVCAKQSFGGPEQVLATTPIALHHPILAERSQNDQCFREPPLVDPGNATLHWFQRPSIKRSTSCKNRHNRRPALRVQLWPSGSAGARLLDPTATAVRNTRWSSSVHRAAALGAPMRADSAPS
jgi:hypothetical protein